MLRLKQQKGFTLIELLVTISIIGILAGIAFLASGSMRQRFQLKAATRQVFSDLQIARLNSIKEGVTWAVCFDADATFTSYSIRNTPGLDGDLCTGDDPLAGADPFYIKNVDLATLYPGVTFGETFGDSDIEFSPRGTASSGGFTVTGQVPPAYAISVNQYTGNIRIR